MLAAVIRCRLFMRLLFASGILQLDVPLDDLTLLLCGMPGCLLHGGVCMCGVTRASTRCFIVLRSPPGRPGRLHMNSVCYPSASTVPQGSRFLPLGPVEWGSGACTLPQVAGPGVEGGLKGRVWMCIDCRFFQILQQVGPLVMDVDTTPSQPQGDTPTAVVVPQTDDETHGKYVCVETEAKVLRSWMCVSARALFGPMLRESKCMDGAVMSVMCLRVNRFP